MAYTSCGSTVGERRVSSDLRKRASAQLRAARLAAAKRKRSHRNRRSGKQSPEARLGARSSGWVERAQGPEKEQIVEVTKRQLKSNRRKRSGENGAEKNTAREPDSSGLASV